MRDFEKYRLRQLLVPIIVLGYATIAVSAVPPGKIELYPFFNWSLFSHSGNPSADTTLIIRSLNGRTLEPPKLLFELKDSFAAARRQDSRLMKILDRFAYAHVVGDEATERRLREILEDRFLGDVAQFEYDLVVLRYDPVERYRTGAIESVEVLGSFSKWGR